MEEKYIKFYKTFHKKFKNDENLILCSKLLCDCRVEQNRELESITLEFSVHFQDNSLCYDDNKERVRNKRQVVLYKLITFIPRVIC